MKTFLLIASLSSTSALAQDPTSVQCNQSESKTTPQVFHINPSKTSGCLSIDSRDVCTLILRHAPGSGKPKSAAIDLRSKKIKVVFTKFGTENGRVQVSTDDILPYCNLQMIAHIDGKDLLCTYSNETKDIAIFCNLNFAHQKPFFSKIENIFR